MIAELFYPRELKEIVADLEAKNNLRCEPLDQLNRFIYVMTLLTLSIGGIALFADGLIVSLVVILIGYLMTLSVLRTHLKFFKAYIFGERQEFMVEKIKTLEFGRLFTSIPNLNVYCKRLSDGKKVKIPFLRQDGLKECNIDLGAKIILYYSDTTKLYPASDTNLFKKEFCLRSDLMEKKNYD